MQKHMVPSMAFKTSPHSDAQDDLLQAFAQGHVETPNVPDPPSSDVPSSSGYSGSIASDVEPAANLEEPAARQEVILYHLNDAPLRVFLDWTTYDSMLTEIAGHYARPVVDVVDAYKVTPHPDDTPPGVVPVIVHMLNDIAMGQQARLALLDVELHGHSFEAHYAIGPSTTRYVVCLPIQCHRSAVLAVADLDRYCMQERDTCLVWHQQIYWPDTDAQPHVLLHGQYFRVAAPPSSRFVCTTQQAVEMAQNRLSEQEMLEQVAGAEVLSEVSPSLLSSDAVRDLARADDIDTDHDLFQALQLVAKPSMPALPTPLPPDKVVPLDPELKPPTGPWLPSVSAQWIQQVQRSQSAHTSATFITWRISPATGKRVCSVGRRVDLPLDVHQWVSLLCEAWADEHVVTAFTQIISVANGPHDLEPGIAGHIILQQHALAMQDPVLITTYDSCIQHGCPTRCVYSFGTHPSPEDVLLSTGYQCHSSAHARFAVRLGKTMLPFGHAFLCCPGDALEVFVQRLSLPYCIEAPSDLDCQDGKGTHSACFEITRQSPVFRRPSRRHISAASSAISEVHTTVISWTPKSVEPQVSITEEVEQRLRARRMHEPGEDQGAPQFAPDPGAIEAQPHFVQELWAIHQHLLASGDHHVDTPLRVETWFLDHLSQDRCYLSRLVDLPHDHTQWRQALVHAWTTHVVPNAELDFSNVYPPPADTNPAVIGQVILTQHPQDEVRSIVLSIYDTARPTPGPFTFALTHGTRITLLSALEEVRLLSVCPPRVVHNECSLWLGDIPIPAPRQAYVRSGNAFRLSIRRGIRYDIQALLSLPDPLLRQHLQEAICGEVYHLPSSPQFPGSTIASASSSNDQIHPPHVQPVPDTRPQWIISLNSFFSLHSATKLREEGPVLYIQVWYVHGSDCLWCHEPRPARLQVSMTTWRHVIMQPWNAELQRSLPLDYWLVHPTPPVGAGWSHTAHIILSQGLLPGQVAVFLAVMPADSGPARAPMAVYILPQDVSAFTIAQMIVPHEHRHLPFRVEHQGITYDAHDTLRVASGDCLVVTYDRYQAPSEEREQSDEDVSLLQIHATPISIAEQVPPSDQDVDGKVLSLGQVLRDSPSSWNVITWELPEGHTDTVMTLPTAFDAVNQRVAFEAKHHLFCSASDLFVVRFIRDR